MEVLVASAAEQCGVPVVTLPTLRSVGMAAPGLPISLRLSPSLDAEPVSMDVWPQTAAAAMPLFYEIPAPVVPDARHLQPLDAPSHPLRLRGARGRCRAGVGGADGAARVGGGAGAGGKAPPPQMQSMLPHDRDPAGNWPGKSRDWKRNRWSPRSPGPRSQPAPMVASAEWRLPDLPDPQAGVSVIAAITPIAAFGVRPAAAPCPSSPAALNRCAHFSWCHHGIRSRSRSSAAMAARGFVPLEFFCQRTSGTPPGKMVWCAPVIPPILPGLALHPILERLEDALPQKKTKQAPAFAAIFDMPDAPRRSRPTPMCVAAIRAVAACFLLGRCCGSAWARYGSAISRPRQPRSSPSAIWHPAAVRRARRRRDRRSTAGWQSSAAGSRAGLCAHASPGDCRSCRRHHDRQLPQRHGSLGHRVQAVGARAGRAIPMAMCRPGNWRCSTPR